jgi:hypothetical protein
VINAVGASVRRIHWLATKKPFMDLKSRTNARYATTPQVKKVSVELADLPSKNVKSKRNWMI